MCVIINVWEFLIPLFSRLPLFHPLPGFLHPLCFYAFIFPNFHHCTDDGSLEDPKQLYALLTSVFPFVLLSVRFLIDKHKVISSHFKQCIVCSLWAKSGIWVEDYWYKSAASQTVWLYKDFQGLPYIVTRVQVTLPY